ncbi:hypothetical protein [Streptacidiphilus fuscans]|uniref:Uncharacterized protein n=1 Tax=Streptacidiphilus fuscans TaxID=2789292 RepID=A0A931BCR2_9ACTN|nr:hypothetical protein [Streptacidiphilus fuscans]MBF9071813.1 hypothetical protein [Streptacidiphilus fuscans]
MTDPDPTPATPRQPPVRMIYHAAPLRPRGFAITCPVCAADRNWLLIHRPNTRAAFIRCRCAHQWIDPEFDLETFEAMYIHPELEFDNAEDIIQAMGFDGTFSGTYLP